MAAVTVHRAFPHLKRIPYTFRNATQKQRQKHTNGCTRFEQLSKRQYWKEKYGESTETFDWFLEDDSVYSLICHALLNVASKKTFSENSKSMYARMQPVNVLDLGCGNSILPLCLYGWKPFPVAVHCLDFVQEAVDFQLKTLRSVPPGHRSSHAFGVCGSVCSLPYQSDLFHLMMDKGTMDALLKDSVHGTKQAKTMLAEVKRVLCQGGSFMQVTDEDPDSRMYFLETSSPPECSWTFSILTNDSRNSKECFVYSFSK